MSVKKFTRIWSIVIAIVTLLAIIVSIVLTGPLYTVMNMYFGKGDAVIKQSEFASSLDGDYYTLEHSDKDSLLDASAKKAEQVEEEGIVLLKNDNQTLPLNKDEADVSLFGRTSVDPVYTGAGSTTIFF